MWVSRVTVPRKWSGVGMPVARRSLLGCDPCQSFVVGPLLGLFTNYPKFGWWLVVLDLTALWDSILVYIGPSLREREKKERNDRREKNVQTNPHPRLLQGPCPTIIQTGRHWKFTQHHRTTRPPQTNYPKSLMQQTCNCMCKTKMTATGNSRHLSRVSTAPVKGPISLSTSNISSRGSCHIFVIINDRNLPASNN